AKSTMLSILATVLTADAGTATIGGHALPAEARAARHVLGLVPQQTAVYPTLTATENLRFFARMHGLAGGAAAAAVGRALEVIGLEGRAGEPVSTFSGGMRRQLRTRRALRGDWLQSVHGARTVDGTGDGAVVEITDTAAVTNVLRAAADSGGGVLELALHRPSLADVFFALTGHGLRDDDTP